MHSIDSGQSVQIAIARRVTTRVWTCEHSKPSWIPRDARYSLTGTSYRATIVRADSAEARLWSSGILPHDIWHFMSYDTWHLVASRLDCHSTRLVTRAPSDKPAHSLQVCKPSAQPAALLCQAHCTPCFCPAGPACQPGAKMTEQGQFEQRGPVFVLASPNSKSCAQALPQVLGHWFCTQNLHLCSRTALAWGGDCQMAARGLNLNSNLNSTAWPTRHKGFNLLHDLRTNCVKFEFFLGLLNMPELIQAVIQIQHSTPRLVKEVNIEYNFCWLVTTSWGWEAFKAIIFAMCLFCPYISYIDVFFSLHHFHFVSNFGYLKLKDSWFRI